MIMLFFRFMSHRYLPEPFPGDESRYRAAAQAAAPPPWELPVVVTLGLLRKWALVHGLADDCPLVNGHGQLFRDVDMAEAPGGRPAISLKISF